MGGANGRQLAFAIISWEFVSLSVLWLMLSDEIRACGAGSLLVMIVINIDRFRAVMQSHERL